MKSLNNKYFFKKGEIEMSEKGIDKLSKYFCILDVINQKIKLYEKGDINYRFKILLNKGVKIEDARDNK